jgi:hypothetical protein
MQSRQAHIHGIDPAEPSAAELAESRLHELAAAVREHERAVSDRPYSVRHADLHLYRRLRQISHRPA